MLVHRSVIHSIKFDSTQFFAWVKSVTVRVKSLAQEHKSMTPAVRAQTQTARFRDERANHETTAPPSPLWATPSNGCLCTIAQPINLQHLHYFTSRIDQV